MAKQDPQSVRLPAVLVEEAKKRALARGLTFSDIVEAGLRKELNMQANPRIDLLSEVAALLQEQYPEQSGFPQDVTLNTFRIIRDDPTLRQLYDEAIADEHGDSLHRRVGKTIPRVLNARVIGRSVELDPDEELIKTYALLVPSDD